jgi:hypothetical protein
MAAAPHVAHPTSCVLILKRATLPDSTPKDSLRALAFSRDSRYLASGGASSAVCLWDLKRKSLSRTYSAHENMVNSVSFSTDGTQLASAGHGGELAFHNTIDGSENMVIVRSKDNVRLIAHAKSQYSQSVPALCLSLKALDKIKKARTKLCPSPTQLCHASLPRRWSDKRLIQGEDRTRWAAWMMMAT